MVAGHLRVQNGVYQMILSYKDFNGKRKTKSISTGLKEKGNARKAERMLQTTRQEFIAPDMAAEYGKDVNESELENNSVLTSHPETELSISNSDMVNESILIQTPDDVAVIPQKISESETDVIPSLDSSLLLKPKEEIRFCDYMLYWLQSSRKKIEADNYLASEMLLPEKSKIYKIVWLYSDGTQLICINTTYIPEYIYPDLTQQIAASAPAIDLITNNRQITLAKSNQKVTLLYADTKTAQILNIPVDSPLMKYKGLMYDKQGHLAVFFENNMLIDRFGFIREVVL